MNNSWKKHTFYVWELETLFMGADRHYYWSGYVWAIARKAYGSYEFPIGTPEDNDAIGHYSIENLGIEQLPRLFPKHHDMLLHFKEHLSEVM